AALGTFWLIVCLDVSFTVLLGAGLNAVYESSQVVKMVRDVLMFPTLLAVNLLLFRITNIGFYSEKVSILDRVSPDRNSDIFDAKDVLIKDKLLAVME